MKLYLERCSLDHLTDLTNFARRTFVDAFETQNNPKDFKDYINTAFTNEAFEEQLLNADSQFYFVKLKTDIVGYFKLNENEAQTELKGNESVELERIYVVKEHQGKKIGHWMIREIIEKARIAKKEFLWLGVWEHNLAAIRFYQKHGFTKFGTHPYYVGKDKQIDWLMRLDLATLDA
ncbi:MAG: GNAT family N-acetyltransferase [Flavobacteriaceae bacterium]